MPCYESSNSEKVSVLLFEFSGLHEDLVLAVDLYQAHNPAAGFLELPCAFNRAAPAGGEGETFDSVGPETFDQGFFILVAVAVCEVNVLVTASLRCKG